MRSLGCGTSTCFDLSFQEVILAHFAVSITVRFINCLMKLLIGHALTELLGDALQVLQSDRTCLVIVEKAESLQDLILWLKSL